MIHRFSRLIPVLIIGLAVSTLWYIGDTSAQAAGPSQAITLTPASVDVAINPGSSASRTVDIINSGADSFTVKMSSAPYYVSGNTYDPHFTQLPGTVDASAWVHVSLTSAPVAGEKLLTVPYTVDVPKDTPAGGYYAVIFAETSADDEKTGVVSHNRVGTILYMTVNGQIKTGGTLIGAPLASVSFAGPIPISAKISNTGGTHFVTRALYSVTDLAGNKVFTASTERYVLPQTEREITTSWSPQVVFGIFTVHRSATVAGQVQSLPDQKIIIINPWIFVALAFVIGVLIAMPMRRARRRSQAN